MIQFLMNKVHLGDRFLNHRTHHNGLENAGHYCGCLDTMEHRVYDIARHCALKVRNRRCYDQWDQTTGLAQSLVLGGLPQQLPLLQQHWRKFDKLPFPDVHVTDAEQDEQDHPTDGVFMPHHVTVFVVCYTGRTDGYMGPVNLFWPSFWHPKNPKKPKNP